ncbi:hypothetical protein ABZX92_05780 [Lentzea sp. NPDC006480]|uniref:hypothetical protein n=1 Tax=Lentzea sp. NPDC006480 TaxID=3157176 RepID=UPI0033A60625
MCKQPGKRGCGERVGPHWERSGGSLVGVLGRVGGTAGHTREVHQLPARDVDIGQRALPERGRENADRLGLAADLDCRTVGG